MNIWLLQILEPLPCDGENIRLLRMGILAKLLVARGHRVIWWTSDFDHVRKKFRFGSDTTLTIGENIQIRLLHSMPYGRNISLQRIINHYGAAKKFAAAANKEPMPDLILSSYPAIETCYQATKYGRHMQVPVVLDVRDLWPDSFLDLCPDWTRWLGSIFLSPLSILASFAFRQACAVTGSSDYMVQWGLKKARREKSIFDRSFPFGYVKNQPSADEIKAAEIFWDNFSVRIDDGWFNVCFVGTIGYQFDLKTVIDAAILLRNKGLKIRFILCGQGDKLMAYKAQAAGCRSIIFPGWLNFPQIWVLMRRSSVGIAPYMRFKSYEFSLTNKMIEYLSSSLPILTCLRGLLREMILTYGCGFIYESGNAKSLSAVLEMLCGNSSLIKNASQNASELFRDKFVAEKVYSDMIEYLEKISQVYNNKKVGYGYDK